MVRRESPIDNLINVTYFLLGIVAHFLSWVVICMSLLQKQNRCFAGRVNFILRDARGGAAGGVGWGVYIGF
jgi:hypothetical protein